MARYTRSLSAVSVAALAMGWVAVAEAASEADGFSPPQAFEIAQANPAPYTQFGGGANVKPKKTAPQVQTAPAQKKPPKAVQKKAKPAGTPGAQQPPVKKKPVTKKATPAQPPPAVQKNPQKKVKPAQAKPVVKVPPPPKSAAPQFKKVGPPPVGEPSIRKNTQKPAGRPNVGGVPLKRVAPPPVGEPSIRPRTPNPAAQQKVAPIVKQGQNAVRRPPPTVIKKTFKAPVKSNRRIGDLKTRRRGSSLAGGDVRLLREPDQRVIVKHNNRTIIRHNESERFRRISPTARTVRLSNGHRQTVFSRGDGVRIYDVVDRDGRLLHRYRVLPGGRRVTLIDNRRYYRDRNRGRDLAIGVGLGLVVGSLVALSAPRMDIPREKYIVDYDDASEYDIYEALSAPPVERLERGYSLDEVRYSSSLRDRMRRVDLDTVTFDFGSWEVGADQERALERMANAINRVLEENPDEVFLIEGYTDAVGDEDDNLSLSDRRAQAVAEILTTSYGVPPENLVTQGYGEENLKIQTDGPERANRRIAVRRISPLMAQDMEREQYQDDGDVYEEQGR